MKIEYLKGSSFATTNYCDYGIIIVKKLSQVFVRKNLLDNKQNKNEFSIILLWNAWISSLVEEAYGIASKTHYMQRREPGNYDPEIRSVGYTNNPPDN